MTTPIDTTVLRAAIVAMAPGPERVAAAAAADALLDEVERLREALGDIVDQWDSSDAYSLLGGTLDRCINAGRAALKEET